MKYTIQSTVAIALLAFLIIAGTYNTTDDQKMLPMPPKTNKPPKANAGADKTIILPDQMSFSFREEGSLDPEGDLSLANSSWEKLSGPDLISLSQSNGTAEIMVIDTGQYIFEFIATDYWGLSSRDTMIVTVKWADHWLR